MPESLCVVASTVCCFLAAALMAIVALVTPTWLVQDFYGVTEYGLFQYCTESLYGSSRRRKCHSLDSIPASWALTAALMVFGLVFLLFAIVSAAASYTRPPLLKRAKWLAFVTATLFSLSCILFPLGFEEEFVGGEAFKLPEKTTVGYSYILYVVGLLLIFIGDIIAMKIIGPV